MLGHAPLGVLALGQLPITNGVALGAVLQLDLTLQAGSATGEIAEGNAFAPGALLPLTLTLDAGIATGEVVRPPIDTGGGGLVYRRRSYDAVARGARINLTIWLLPGRATGTVEAPPEPAQAEPVPAVDATASGALIVLETVLVAGTAGGDTVAYDNAFLLVAA